MSNKNKWKSLGLKNIGILSKYNINDNGNIFPLTKKRLDDPIWLATFINKVLPVEIVRYICLLCILSNNKRWKKNHKRLSWRYFNNISIVKNNRFLSENDTIEHGDEIWYFSPYADKSRIEEPFNIPINIENDSIPNEPGSPDMNEWKYDIGIPSINVRKICRKYIKQWSEEYNTPEIQIVHLTYKITERLCNIHPMIIMNSCMLWDDREQYGSNDFVVCSKCRCYYCDIIRFAGLRKNKKYTNLIHDLHISRWSSYPKPLLGRVIE